LPLTTSAGANANTPDFRHIAAVKTVGLTVGIGANRPWLAAHRLGAVRRGDAKQSPFATITTLLSWRTIYGIETLLRTLTEVDTDLLLAQITTLLPGTALLVLGAILGAHGLCHANRLCLQITELAADLPIYTVTVGLTTTGFANAHGFGHAHLHATKFTADHATFAIAVRIASEGQTFALPFRLAFTAIEHRRATLFTNSTVVVRLAGPSQTILVDRVWSNAIVVDIIWSNAIGRVDDLNVRWFHHIIQDIHHLQRIRGHWYILWRRSIGKNVLGRVDSFVRAYCIGSMNDILTGHHSGILTRSVNTRVPRTWKRLRV